MKDFPESEKSKYLEEVFKDRDFIRAKIKELIASYSEERCRRMLADLPSKNHPVAPGSAH